MADNYDPQYSDSDSGKLEDLAEQDAVPEARKDQAPKYDMSKFSDADLTALKDIRGRAAPVKERRDIRERIDKEDIEKLG